MAGRAFPHEIAGSGRRCSTKRAGVSSGEDRRGTGPFAAEDDNAAVSPQKAAEVLGAAVRPMAVDWFAATRRRGISGPRRAAAANDAGASWRLLTRPSWARCLPRPAPANAASMSFAVCRWPRRWVAATVSAGPAARSARAGVADGAQRSRIGLDYSAGPAPVLAVRLQEVFGWTDTPRVANGRVAVLLHLLGRTTGRCRSPMTCAASVDDVFPGAQGPAHPISEARVPETRSAPRRRRREGRGSDGTLLSTAHHIESERMRNSSSSSTRRRCGRERSV